MYGAVQQENRLSKAIDIILKYVENLKLIYDKEKTDHEETRLVNQLISPLDHQINNNRFFNTVSILPP